MKEEENREEQKGKRERERGRQLEGRCGVCGAEMRQHMWKRKERERGEGEVLTKEKDLINK